MAFFSLTGFERHPVGPFWWISECHYRLSEINRLSADAGTSAAHLQISLGLCQIFKHLLNFQKMPSINLRSCIHCNSFLHLLLSTKGLVHPRKTILSSFTHTHFVLHRRFMSLYCKSVRCDVCKEKKNPLWIMWFNPRDTNAIQH